MKPQRCYCAERMLGLQHIFSHCSVTFTNSLTSKSLVTVVTHFSSCSAGEQHLLLTCGPCWSYRIRISFGKIQRIWNNMNLPFFPHKWLPTWSRVQNGTSYRNPSPALGQIVVCFPPVHTSKLTHCWSVGCWSVLGFAAGLTFKLQWNSFIHHRLTENTVFKFSTEFIAFLILF